MRKKYNYKQMYPLQYEYSARMSPSHDRRGIKSSGLRRVVGLYRPDVSKTHSAFIFRVISEFTDSLTLWTVVH